MTTPGQLEASSPALVEPATTVPARAEPQQAPRRPRQGNGPSLREVAFATVALGVFAFLAFRSHITHGSFYYDDWSNAALTAYPPHSGFFGSLEAFWELTGYRPLLAFYIPTLHTIWVRISTSSSPGRCCWRCSWP